MYYEADLVTGNEGAREDIVDYDSSTSEAIGGNVCVGNSQIGDRPNACVRRGSEQKDDGGEKRLKLRHGNHK